MEKLTKWREQSAKISKGRMAHLIGCDPSQVGRWENGLSYQPSFETIEKIDRLTGGEVTILDWYESWLNRSE